MDPHSLCETHESRASPVKPAREQQCITFSTVVCISLHMLYTSNKGKYKSHERLYRISPDTKWNEKNCPLVGHP